MNDDHDASDSEKKPPEPPADYSYSYDHDWRLTGGSEGIRSDEPNTVITTYRYRCVGPKVAVEHDREKRVFRLTADGKTEVFRDNATRYLVVEPDPVTGEIMPVIREGKPKFLWLCRQEHEVS
jgi:hypothetical protein